jgi:hypothetical protein
VQVRTQDIKDGPEEEEDQAVTEIREFDVHAGTLYLQI